MKSYRILTVSAALIALMSAGAASAQFKAPGLGGLGGMGGGGGARGGSASNATSLFMTHFTQAQTEINAGQILLAQAFGLKDQVALLEAEQTALSSGVLDADGYKKSKELSESANAEIAQRMDSGAALSAEGRKQYEASLPHLMQGTVALVRMAPDGVALAQASQSSMSSGSMSDKAGMAKNAAAVGAIAKGFPGVVGNAKTAYGRALTYGKSNKIPVPKDATDALGTM